MWASSNSNCLLSGHNDDRSGIHGDSLWNNCINVAEEEVNAIAIEAEVSDQEFFAIIVMRQRTLPYDSNHALGEPVFPPKQFLTVQSMG